MPPKRKRADVDSESLASGSRSGEVTSTTRSKTSTTSGKKSTASKRSKAKQKVDLKAEPHQHNTELENPESSFKKGTETSFPRNKKRRRGGSAEGLSVTLNSTSTSSKPSAYSQARMENLFATYTDVDDPSIIGGEGLEKLCNDANISMEGAQPLILAWLLDASELGKLTKEEWLEGFHALQIDTLEKLKIALTEFEALLISNTIVLKPPSSNKKSAVEPYDRSTKYWHYAADASTAFLKFYQFVFSIAKAPQERNIDVEIAKVFWSTLLGQKYPLVNELIQYIDNKTSLKGVNKDLWAMTLDFFRCVSPTLEGYDAEGAWPALLDEFAAWKIASGTHTVTSPLVSNN